MKFKKILSIVLAFVLTFSVCAVSTLTVNATSAQDYYSLIVKDKKMPNLINLTQKRPLTPDTAHQIKSDLLKIGFRVYLNGQINNTTKYLVVTSQYPQAKAPIKKGQTIRITIENANRINTNFIGSKDSIVKGVKKLGFKNVFTSYPGNLIPGVLESCSNLKIKDVNLNKTLYYSINTPVKLVLTKNDVPKYCRFRLNDVKGKSYAEAVSILKKAGFHNFLSYGPKDGKVNIAVYLDDNTLFNGSYDCCTKIILVLSGKNKVPDITSCCSYEEVKHRLIKEGFTDFKVYGNVKKMSGNNKIHFAYKSGQKVYVDNNKLAIDTNSTIYVGFNIDTNELIKLANLK